MVTNAFFLLSWRYLPQTDFFLECMQTLRAKVLFMVFASLTIWFIGSLITYELIGVTQAWGWNFRALGIMSTVMLLILGVALTLVQHVRN